MDSVSLAVKAAPLRRAAGGERFCENAFPEVVTGSLVDLSREFWSVTLQIGFLLGLHPSVFSRDLLDLRICLDRVLTIPLGLRLYPLIIIKYKYNEI